MATPTKHLAMPFVVLLALFLAAPAHAKQECVTKRTSDVVQKICGEAGTYSASSLSASHYEADEDGNGYIELYRTGDFGGAVSRLRRVYNRQEANRFPDEARIRMVKSKARADTWIHFADTGQKGCAGQAFNRALIGPKDLLDEIRINVDCKAPDVSLLLHEAGHNFTGLGHVQCTSHNQRRSVMVARLDKDGKTVGGCNVMRDRFGRLDIRKARPYDPLGM